MPYIPQRYRSTLDEAQRRPVNGGELNYVIAEAIDGYIAVHGLSYQTIAEVRAAATGAVDEFNRKVAHPYEDIKAQMNGEVFTASLHHLGEAQ